MAFKHNSKINKFRTFALALVFIGILIMYGGLFLQANPFFMTLLMIIGFLCIILSTIIYFWVGMISTKTIQVICPTCNKKTKMLGRVDACMYCNEPLTLDKDLEGKEFDIKYNRKS